MIAQPKTNADQVHNLAEGAGYQLRYVIKHVPELAKIAVDPLAIFNWNYIGGQEPTSTETYYDPDNVPHTVTTYQGQVFNTGAENLYIYRHYNANAQSVNKRPIYTIQAGRIMNCALAIGDVIIPQSVMYAINISNCTLSNEAIPRDRALQSVVITDIHTNYYINLSNKNDIIAITDEYINRLDAEFQRLAGGLHLENYVPTSRTINGYPLTNDITLTASDIEGIPASQDLTGYVQNTRKINGKDLKQNITLTYADLNLDSRYLKLAGGTLTGQLISTYSGNDNVPISLNKIGVGAYRDIQALRTTTDGSTKRVGTIRFQANTETNDLILGVSNGSNSGPSGINISRNLETGVTTVTAPTPASGDNSTKIATTAWVKANLSNYVPITRKVNNKQLNADITLTATDVGAFSEATENWGTLKGYATTGTATTINDTCTEANVVNSAVIVENGTEGRAWTKIVKFDVAATVTLKSNWKWVNDDVPTIVAGGILFCTWCGNRGIASFLSPD